MKKNKKIQRLAAVMLSLLLLCSCTAQHEYNDGGGSIKTHDISSQKSEIPKIPDTGYRTGNILFDMTLTDGVRSIEMSVNRCDGVLRCELTSPVDLAGVNIISDVGGVRIFADNCELGISEEAGAAFKALFSALELDTSDSAISSDGEGGVLYKWVSGEYELTLCLNGDGIPSRLSCSGNGMTREGKIDNFRIN